MKSLSEVESLSARRAWIEIMGRYEEPFRSRVALRKESVDRNEEQIEQETTPEVALRKESVDRNFMASRRFRASWVALRKESVDRNSDGVVSGSADYGRSPQGERG